MMEIYGRANAWNVRKVTFLAEDIKLPYQRSDYGRGFAPTNTPEFLVLNPNAMVPVMIDDDVVIWESHSILRYMAAKFAPESYYPKDLARRAYVDQWLDWKTSHIGLPIRLLFFKHYLKSDTYTDKEVADADADATKFMTILDGHLGKTNAFVAGDNFTIADCAIGMAVHRWLDLPVTHPDVPNISRYYTMLSQRPSYRETVLIGMP